MRIPTPPSEAPCGAAGACTLGIPDSIMCPPVQQQHPCWHMGSGAVVGIVLGMRFMGFLGCFRPNFGVVSPVAVVATVGLAVGRFGCSWIVQARG